MTNLLVRWVVSAVALMVTAYVIPGISVNGITAAFIAAAVIGLVNATLGGVLKILTFPVTVVTLGLFSLVINALMLMLAANLVAGFHVSGFLAAFFGSILMSIVGAVLGSLLPSGESKGW